MQSRIKVASRHYKGFFECTLKNQFLWVHDAKYRVAVNTALSHTLKASSLAQTIGSRSTQPQHTPEQSHKQLKNITTQHNQSNKKSLFMIFTHTQALQHNLLYTGSHVRRSGSIKPTTVWEMMEEEQQQHATQCNHLFGALRTC